MKSIAWLNPLPHQKNTNKASQEVIDVHSGGRSSSKIGANSVKISAEATSPLSAPPPSEFSIRHENVNTADTGKLGVNENFTMGNSQRRHWSSREGPNDLGISLFNGLQEDRAFVYTRVWFIWWERHRSLHSHDESGLSSLSAEGMIKFRNPGNNNKLGYKVNCCNWWRDTLEVSTF